MNEPGAYAEPKPKYKLWRRVGNVAKWEVAAGPTDDVWQMLASLLEYLNIDSNRDHRFVQYRVVPAEENLN